MREGIASSKAGWFEIPKKQENYSKNVIEFDAVSTEMFPAH